MTRALLLPLLIVVAILDVHGQVLQLVPSTHTDRGPQSFLEACMHVNQWPTVYQRTTYLGAVSWQLRPDRASDSTLARCFAQMRATRLQLSLEVSVTGAFTTGLEAYQSGRLDWQRYQDLGAPIAAFFIDEPLTNGTRLPPGLSYATVVDETANWIALVRRDPRFRNVRLTLIEAYPYISSTAVVDFINDLNNAAAIRGVEGLDGLQIDHAWDGQDAWSGSDMATMRAAAHRRRMEFSIIFYAAMPFQNPTDDCDFRARMYEQWKSYSVNGVDYYGFYPDIYTIQSWDQLPSVTVPESAGCTFMQGAKEWLDSIAIIPPVHPGLHDRVCRSQSAIERTDCEQLTVR